MGIKPYSNSNISYLAFMALLTVALITCNRYGTTDELFARETDRDLPATLEIRLTDGPSRFDNIHVHIKALGIASSEGEEMPWREYEVKSPGHYDLQQYGNGSDTLLFSEKVPPGKLSRIRLILGDEHYVVCNSQTHQLTPCEDAEDFLVLELDETLSPDQTHRIWIDFDGHRSVISSREGEYILRPSLRHFNESSGGWLTGTVSPAESLATIWAVLGSDSLRASPDGNGNFLIPGMKDSDQWNIIFTAEPESGFRDTVLWGVSILPGVATQLEDVLLGRENIELM